MKPPICYLCHRPLGALPPGTNLNDSLVKFADYEPLPDGMVGHPHGLEWFCSDHAEAARKVANLPIDAAMKAIRKGKGAHQG